jgi:hypothetical protein
MLLFHRFAVSNLETLKQAPMGMKQQHCCDETLKTFKPIKH